VKYKDVFGMNSVRTEDARLTRGHNTHVLLQLRLVCRASQANFVFRNVSVQRSVREMQSHIHRDVFFLYSVHAEDTRFLRAQHGGILRIHAEDTRFMRAQHGAPFWRHFELPRILCTHFSFWHGRSILACIL